MSDIDTWALDNAVRDLREAIPGSAWTPEIDNAFSDVQYEIDNLECEANHCDEGDESEAGIYVRDLLVKIRMGVYDEKLDGSLEEILEQIMRDLNE